MCIRDRPPEVIGLGRGFEEIKAEMGSGTLDRLLEDYYPSIKSDLEYAFQFLDFKVADDFLSERAQKLLRRDLELIKHFMELDVAPNETYGTLTRMLKPYIYQALRAPEESATRSDLAKVAENLIVKTAEMRGCLG